MAGIDYAYRAAAIIRDAGGHIVGRTKLQKIGFFLEAAGIGSGFPFRYRHYGPYSEQLAAAAQHAAALRLIIENESIASWGGQYSIFFTQMPSDSSTNPARLRLAQEMAGADAVELELAATAAFLANEGFTDPWAETARRKPDKAEDGRLERAMQLYGRLRQVPTPKPLPAIWRTPQSLFYFRKTCQPGQQAERCAPAAVPGFLARINALRKRPSTWAATASTSMPLPVRNSRASSA